MTSSSQLKAFLALALLFPAGFLSADETEGRTRVRVAAISYVPKKLDLNGNADRLEKAIREARAGGAKIAVAPEGALDGYVINEIIAGKATEAQLKEASLSTNDPIFKRFQNLARELEICVVFGFAERIGDELFNCAVFLDNKGNISGKYHKMQFAEGYHDSWWWNRLGAKSRAFDTPYGRCGLMICNDRWNPQLARIPVLDGAQFLIIPAFGSRSRAQDEAVIARANENGVPVIEANVGVTMVIDQQNHAIHTDRRENGITFAEITIPKPTEADPIARNHEEKKFLAWRTKEMRTRYLETIKKRDAAK